MKDLKKKLTAAGAMLVVSAVMLSGVSYAWYTLSTNPEVSNIKANIAANENLEIALDNGYTSGEGTTGNTVDVASQNKNAGGVQGSTTGNPYTWGNTIDLKTALQDSNGGAKVELQPVSYVGKASGNTGADAFGNVTINYPQYGTDGRVSGVVPTGKHIIKDTADAAKGGVYFYTNKAYSDNETEDAIGTPYAFSMTYWMRTNANGSGENPTTAVTLTGNPAKLANNNDNNATGVNGKTGSGSYIKLPVSGKNNSNVVKAFAKNIVISVVDESTGSIVGYARLAENPTEENNSLKYELSLKTKPNNSTETASDASITLKKNEGKKITTYVYLDGASMTNKDALLDDLTGMEINLQFTANLSNAMTGDTVSGN